MHQNFPFTIYKLPQAEFVIWSHYCNPWKSQKVLIDSITSLSEMPNGSRLRKIHQIARVKATQIFHNFFILFQAGNKKAKEKIIASIYARSHVCVDIMQS